MITFYSTNNLIRHTILNCLHAIFHFKTKSVQKTGHLLLNESWGTYTTENTILCIHNSFLKEQHYPTLFVTMETPDQL